MVLGVCGLNGAGKSVLCAALAELCGFKVLSLSDAIRASLRADGMEVSRANLIERGTALRNEGGPGTLGTLIGGEIVGEAGKEESTSCWVVDSFRHPAEAECLSAVLEEAEAEFAPFLLVAVDAEPSVRYARMVSRARPGDSIASLEEWQAAEDLELAHPDPNGQQLAAVLRAASVRIDNNTDGASQEGMLHSLISALAAAPHPLHADALSLRSSATDE